MSKLFYKFRIGEGLHGTVYLFEDTTHTFIVCKSIPIKHSKRAKTEISILKETHHINLIKIISAYQNRTNIFIFLEYANYGTLEDLIEFLKKNNLRIKTWFGWSCFTQLISGIAHLHSRSIVHRDLKPANILLNKRRINSQTIIEFKICDFSLSAYFDKLKGEKTLLGTPYYMAPEVIRKEGYNEKVDVWGLGVCLYELFALKRPFNISEQSSLYEEILSKIINDVPNCTDKKLSTKILKCLQKNNRISIFDLKMSDCILEKIVLFNELYTNTSFSLDQESLFSLDICNMYTEFEKLK